MIVPIRTYFVQLIAPPVRSVSMDSTDKSRSRAVSLKTFHRYNSDHSMVSSVSGLTCVEWSARHRPWGVARHCLYLYCRQSAGRLHQQQTFVYSAWELLTSSPAPIEYRAPPSRFVCTSRLHSSAHSHLADLSKPPEVY